MAADNRKHTVDYKMTDVNVVDSDGKFLFLYTGPIPNIGENLRGYIVIGVDIHLFAEIVVET